ncbi:hypothetical protein GUF47_02490, partial [Xanthomonas citri pv. citri]|nr:hypothetical protein [Xanthomonas citri pv. citri]
KMLIENNIVPSEFAQEVRFFRFKDYISKKVYKTLKSPKDKLFLLDDVSASFYNQHFSEDSVVDMLNGQLVISEKAFN